MRRVRDARGAPAARRDRRRDRAGTHQRSTPRSSDACVKTLPRAAPATPRCRAPQADRRRCRTSATLLAFCPDLLVGHVPDRPRLQPVRRNARPDRAASAARPRPRRRLRAPAPGMPEPVTLTAERRDLRRLPEGRRALQRLDRLRPDDALRLPHAGVRVRAGPPPEGEPCIGGVRPADGPGHEQLRRVAGACYCDQTCSRSPAGTIPRGRRALQSVRGGRSAIRIRR